MSEFLLVLNEGSSSLKFCVYGRAGGQDWQPEARGQAEGIGAALAALEAALRNAGPGARLLGVGHRVVHGGPHHKGPAIVTPALMAELRELIPLAPLHQPCNLAAITAIGARLPGVAQVACFDTSFHHGQPAVARLVPLPLEIRSRGVQRYGFHGLSCEYVASVLPQVAPASAGGRVVVAHLGSGASLCALRAGRSIDSSFGFTALDGLCMGTRPGALDPGVVLYLFQTLGLSAVEVEHMLYRQSGLLGISGLSNDMRALLKSSEPSARLAVDYFVYRATKEIGALAAVLGGLDALVFTAGIGENSPEIRARICAASAWLGIDLDPDANLNAAPRISRRDSRVSAWIIPTNEELMIARHSSSLLGLG